MSGDQLSMFGGGNQAEGSARFSLSKTINAGQQQVCDYWLIPVLVGKWMFGSKVQAEKILKLENTVRKDGEFNYQIQRRGQTVVHSGVFTELDIPSKLSFSWAESSNPKAQCRITVHLVPDAGRTRVKMSVKIPPQLSADLAKIKRQWTARCDALAKIFG